MKRIITLVLAIVMLATATLAFNSCGAQSDWAKIEEQGFFVCGITVYAPMNYFDEDSNLVGFDTEFAQAVAAELGVEAKFQEISWAAKETELAAKNIDCIWNGMTITDEVLKNTSCSKAYLRNAQVVVMSKEDVAEYKDAKSMKDLKFAVEAGSAGEKAAKANGFKDVVSAAAQTDAFLEVESGACDACIIDLTMANAMINKKK